MRVLAVLLLLTDLFAFGSPTGAGEGPSSLSQAARLRRWTMGLDRCRKPLPLATSQCW